MAARRLIVVLVVLLAISIAAAAVAPDRRSPLLGDSDETEETTEEAPSTTPEPTPSGELVEATIVADPADPETVRADPGDQIELQVETARPREVEIKAFGLLEPAEPDAPATFNLLLREAGQLAITDAESGVIVGRIVAEPEEPDKSPPQAGDGRPQGGGSSSAEPV